MDSGKFFLEKDIEYSIKGIQKAFFGIIDDLKSQDSDNLERLKSLIQNPIELEGFRLFQENRSKVIRKRILDISGDSYRELLDNLADYIIQTKPNVEFKGVSKDL